MQEPDILARDRRPTRSGAPSVVLVNKPYGMLCQFSAPIDRPTLADIVPIRNVYAAGRLDADSEGLVVLTADGPLQARIADPRHKLGKRYWVQVEGTPDANQIRALAEGVDVDGRRTRPAHVRPVAEPAWLWARVPPIRVRKAIPTAWLAIELFEGRNRQVRRMTAAVGLPTLRLVRTSVGPWSLDGLAPGQWRIETVRPDDSMASAGARRRARFRRPEPPVL